MINYTMMTEQEYYQYKPFLENPIFMRKWDSIIKRMGIDYAIRMKIKMDNLEREQVGIKEAEIRFWKSFK